VNLEGEQVLLRIHLSTHLRWRMAPLYEALVMKARREHLSGATVLSGIYGYATGGRLLGDHPIALEAERPVVVEIVDREEALLHFLDGVEDMLVRQPVLATIERAHVVHYRGGGAGERT